MASIQDERAPGVAPAMRRRIGAALEAGERPTLRGNNLRLGSIVLQRTDGRDAPALREVELQMERRNLDTTRAFDTFMASTTRRGRGTYATDTTGRQRMVARQVGGVNRVTKAGRRFYKESYTRYIIHVPTYHVRRSTGERFRNDKYDITGEELGMDVELNVRGTDQEKFEQLNRAYDAWIASGKAEEVLVPTSDFGASDLRIDFERRPTFDVQKAYVRDGKLTADTILDRVVFGDPIMAEDMWQMHRIHEVSRRRNGECGLDVIVAAATQRQGHHRQRQLLMSAEEASRKLVELAREFDPNGALATHSIFEDIPLTAEIAGVDEDLRLRAPDITSLQPFEAGMRAFLAKSRSVQDIQTAATKQHIWRKCYAVSASFAATLKQAFPWCATARTRLLLCLRAWGLHVAGEQVSIEKPTRDNARQCIRTFGTPVDLMVKYVRSCDQKLVLLNGSRCMQTWKPPDWDTRSAENKVVIILNVWGDHVFTYTSEAGAFTPDENLDLEWPEVRLATSKCVDEHRYDEMLELDWAQLTQALQEKRKGVVFWTVAPLETLEDSLRASNLAFVPHYSAPSQYTYIDVLFYDGKRQASVRIRRVPSEHAQLRAFCESVQDELHLKLYYKGESFAVVGHNFVREFLVTKREAIPQAEVRALKLKQNNRCAKCNDLLSRWEVHHDPPVKEGGRNVVQIGRAS